MSIQAEDSRQKWDGTQGRNMVDSLGQTEKIKPEQVCLREGGGWHQSKNWHYKHDAEKRLI